MVIETARVYLIGAGPGDPELLTLRGKRLLQQAELVLYDYLVDPRVLAHARAGAELVCLGRHGQGRLLSQEEVNQQMIGAARAGKTVVRLKGGDPAIFGRLGEEIAALEAQGIGYEVVPGVTAALGAGSYAGIPLTHREFASSVAFVTGQQCRDKQPEALDLEGLARFPGTLVFYMGVTTVDRWASGLIEHGKPADTPVAIVRRCSLPEQQVLSTTLEQLPELFASSKLRPPVVIIVGEVVYHRFRADWFAERPLVGQSVMVTRPRHQSEELVAQLAELGAATWCQPAIEISPPGDWGDVDEAIERLTEFDWLVFSSANGVRHFLDRLLATGHDLRQLSGCRLASIGPATSEALADYRLKADLEPETYRAEALAAALQPVAVGQRVLLLRANRGREVLAELLTKAGASVEQVVVYRSSDTQQPESEIATALAGGEIDWITVTSSAIARSLVRLFGDDLRRARLAAISPLTADVLAGAGYPAEVIASQYTTTGLVEAILQHADRSAGA